MQLISGKLCLKTIKVLYFHLVSRVMKGHLIPANAVLADARVSFFPEMFADTDFIFHSIFLARRGVASVPSTDVCARDVCVASSVRFSIGAFRKRRGMSISTPGKSRWFSRELLVVVWCATLLSLPWVERPFHTRGEAREALVAQAMIDTGDWISPSAYDGSVPSKPPFAHWLISLCSLPGGEVTEATSRLPSVLGLIIFSIFFFRFLARRTSEQEALGVSLIVLTSFEWFRSGVTCRVDTILAVSIAGCLLALFSWWEKKYRGIPWIAMLLAGCATLTKGPVGFVLPVGIFSLFALLRGGSKQLSGIIVRGTVITIPVVMLTSIWYVLGFLQRGEPFIEKIWYENIARFTSTMADKPHQHSVFYLLGVLFLGLSPWSFLLFFSAIRRNVWHKGLVFSLRTWWSKADPFLQYACIVAGCILVFFCIPSSKRSVYLLPAYPFIAIVLYRFLFDSMRGSAFVGTILPRIILAVVIISYGVGVISFWYPIAGFSLRFEDFLVTLTPLKSSLCGLGVYVVVRYRQVLRALTTPVVCVALSMVAAVVMSSFFTYDTAAMAISPKRWYRSTALVSLVGDGTPRKYYSYGREMYEISFYLRRQFQRLEGTYPNPGDLIFTQRRNLDELNEVIALPTKEVLRYASGVESPKRAVIVLEVLSPEAGT